MSTSVSTARYNRATENTLGAPGTSLPSLVTPEALPPIQQPRCDSWGTLEEWVPAAEASVVPDEQADLCLACPGRRQCLMWALVTRSDGYWAATTTDDRRIMLQQDNASLDLADVLRAAQLLIRAAQPEPPHPVGEGSVGWYRRSCHCPECRRANSVKRAGERRRAAERAALAA